jgi:hypothetical protein
MPQTKKSSADILVLKDVLAKYLNATMPVVVETADSNGNPVLTFSADATPTTGEKIAVILIKPAAIYTTTDILGNTAIQVSNHVVQVVTERNFEGTTDNVLDILTGEYLFLFCELAKLGHPIEWYRTTAGTAPTIAGITGTPTAAWNPNLYTAGSHTGG